jgi:hypothetical protein
MHGSRVASVRVALERTGPIILLIEDDEFDRATLTRMLEEAGYRVIAANRGTSAIDTFAINHQRVSLVLASTGLSDVERIRLDKALYRIDPFVPVVIAARRPLHRPNSGEDVARHKAFLTLIGEVHRLLRRSSARAAAQAQSFAQVQAPAPEAEFARPAGARHSAPPQPSQPARASQSRGGAADEQGVFFPDIAPLAWSGSSQLKSVANLDPRSYLKRLSSARRSRRRRLGRISIAVAAACCAPLVVAPLWHWRSTVARAIAQEEPAPLASASLSGVVPLVSAAHLKRPNLAADLAPRIVPPKPARADIESGQR